MSWNGNNYPEPDDSICPVCGKGMERGFIVSDRGIYWKDHVPKFACTGKTMGPHGRSWFGFANVEAFRCRSCRIIRHLYEEHEDERSTPVMIRCYNCGETHHYARKKSEDDYRYCPTCSSKL
ncbi:MAG: PF20097 family protein [Candidatus Thorarchaeota archaeon]|nr:PF20097 family protein [Candidatus Thorarchaeota archaeon]